MRTRRWLHPLILLGLLVLIGIGLAFQSKPLPIFPATVSRDCAPWDGAAFTIRIPFDNGDLLTIGIWQAPDFAFYESFQFPDHTGRKGYVQLIHPAGLTEALTGKVWFAGVGEELPIEGGFSLRSERGAVLEGRFQAQWETHWVLCG